MIFADSGYFIALLKDRDALHERALRWADAVREPVLLTDYVLIEVVNNCSAPTISATASCLFGTFAGFRNYFRLCPLHPP